MSSDIPHTPGGSGGNGRSSSRQQVAATADDGNTPPFDHRGHRSICFVFEQFRMHQSTHAARESGAEGGGVPRMRPADAPPVRQRVRTAHCFRIDPNHERQAWWNLVEGVHWTRFLSVDDPTTVPPSSSLSSLSPSSATSTAAQSPVSPGLAPAFGARSQASFSVSTRNDDAESVSRHRSRWTMDQRGEVHLGEMVGQMPERVTTVIHRTFDPPIEITTQYLHGFTDGTHLSLLQRVADNIASGAPLRAAQRVIDLWTTVYRNYNSSQSGSPPS